MLLFTFAELALALAFTEFTLVIFVSFFGACRRLGSKAHKAGLILAPKPPTVAAGTGRPPVALALAVVALAVFLVTAALCVPALAGAHAALSDNALAVTGREAIGPVGLALLLLLVLLRDNLVDGHTNHLVLNLPGDARVDDRPDLRRE